MIVSDWFDKGIALARLKMFYEAIACFDEVLKVNPRNADALYNKGVAVPAWVTTTRQSIITTFPSGSIPIIPMPEQQGYRARRTAKPKRRSNISTRS